MTDCQFCAEMPAVVNQRWCEPCWAEICEAGKRVEELRAFYKRAEALSKPSKTAQVSTLARLWKTSIKTQLRRLLTWR